MPALLHDLLAFSRRGRRAIAATRIDLDEVLRDTMAALRLEKSGVEFALAPLGQAVGDRALLADVFGNLLANAVKFSARRPAPRVEVGREETGGEPVWFVKDNGVGFRLDHATRLFEPFQRLHAADGYEGTGVGLAIVRRIVERHGGRVWAESSPSRGSTFRFTLGRIGLDDC
jgi:light-regulated signal transduction histidine kinase (bacteriophytochrome)